MKRRMESTSLYSGTPNKNTNLLLTCVTFVYFCNCFRGNTDRKSRWVYNRRSQSSTVSGDEGDRWHPDWRRLNHVIQNYWVQSKLMLLCHRRVTLGNPECSSFFFLPFRASIFPVSHFVSQSALKVTGSILTPSFARKFKGGFLFFIIVYRDRVTTKSLPLAFLKPIPPRRYMGTELW